MHDLLLVALASLTLLLAPGPTNAVLAAAGATRGLVGAAPLLLAQATGYLLAITIARMVLGQISAGEPWLVGALKLAVALYLLLLARRLWCLGVAPTGQVDAVGFRDVLVITLLNPKALVLAFGIMPAEPAPLLPHLLVVTALTFCSGGLWIALGSSIARSAPQLVSRATAVLLGIVALVVVASVLR